MYRFVDGGEPEWAPAEADDSTPALFEAFYRAQYADVYAYVLRRLSGLHEDVADVTAEVFATAWRRSDQMPPPPHDRLWAFGVARRVVSRHRRSHWRRHRLARRLNEQRLATPDDGPDDVVRQEEGLADRLVVRQAIEHLRDADREVLALVLWDGLTHGEAARVLGCSENAVGIRLHRARQRLRTLLETRLVDDHHEEDDE